MKRRELFDPIEPFDTGFLQVAAGTRSTTSSAAIRAASRRCSCTAGPAAAAMPNARRFFDPRALPHRALRPARLRAQSRRTRRSRTTRPGISSPTSSAARAPRHRALAGVRRLLGQHARARVRRDASRARHRARAARHLPAAHAGDRLVLPARREHALPGRVGAPILDADPRGRARRSARAPTTGASRRPRPGRRGSRPRAHGRSGRARRAPVAEPERRSQVARRGRSRSRSRASSATTS